MSSSRLPQFNSDFSSRLHVTYDNPSYYSAGNRSVVSKQENDKRTLKSVTTYRSTYISEGEELFQTEKNSIFQKIQHSIWNAETKELLGRTWDSWLKIIAYYICFYAVIVGLWATCWAIFDWRVLMEDYPVRTGFSSKLDMSPGLSYIPQPDYYTSLIRFKRSQSASIGKYIDEILAVTQIYEDHAFQSIGQSNEVLRDCARVGGPEKFDERTVCRFNLDVGGRCNIYRQFGFADGEPCIVLKLNRIYGWIPDLPSNWTGVRVECYGIHDSDKEAIGDNICYHDDNDIFERDRCSLPYGEFKHYYFPYLKQNRYQSPLIFVEFVKMKPNTIVMVECKATANNIRIDRRSMEGVIRFELLSD